MFKIINMLMCKIITVCIYQQIKVDNKIKVWDIAKFQIKKSK